MKHKKTFEPGTLEPEDLQKGDVIGSHDLFYEGKSGPLLVAESQLHRLRLGGTSNCTDLTGRVLAAILAHMPVEREVDEPEPEPETDVVAQLVLRATDLNPTAELSLTNWAVNFGAQPGMTVEIKDTRPKKPEPKTFEGTVTDAWDVVPQHVIVPEHWPAGTRVRVEVLP